MRKKLRSLDEIKALYQSGDVVAAKEACQELLQVEPQHPEVLHLLGILYVELDDLDLAEDYLERAMEIDPQNVSLTLHMANVLKAKGLFNKAANVLTHLIERHPQFAAAFNNLGTVYYAQGKLQEAVNSYQKAIELQAEYGDAYYNLGLALQKLNQTDEAMNAYQALLELLPHHPGGQFQLGCLFMRQQQYENAIQHFVAIEKEHPHHFETQVNLASCYLKVGKLNESKSHYLKALELVSADAQVLFNLGIINMKQGHIDEAIKYYLQTVKVEPDLFDAHNNLAIAYLFKKDNEQALLHFKEALRIQPKNEAIRHTITILSREKSVSNSPPQYISALFDSYADHYEPHLKQVLHYHVPELIIDAIKTIVEIGKANLDILDLGCGTGLCGELLVSSARSLVGVDLSNNMLEVAQQKHIYTELVATDILSFLQNKHDSYDLIVAGDVLVYFGELHEVFFAVNKALRTKGLFVFNVEISATHDYVMTESGRFAHSQQYLHKLAESHLFRIVKENTVTMRVQNEMEVKGYLIVLQKIS